MAARSLEIRIPISPTRSFYHQVRFFEHALGRLGGVYAAAKVLVVVGGDEPLHRIVADNPWSAGRRIEWIGVPPEVFARDGIHGTADYRYQPESTADLIVLSDADTVFARNIDPLLERIDTGEGLVAGHMAHWPPAPASEGALAGIGADDLWPALLRAFSLKDPVIHGCRYSMDGAGRFKPVPPYFNLGFIALTNPALCALRPTIPVVQERLQSILPSHMRCQIALSLAALQLGLRLETLPAEYNAANDTAHMTCNGLTADCARVIHYLREDELNRTEVVLPENLPGVLAREFRNPLNRIVQHLLRFYAADEYSIGAAE